MKSKESKTLDWTVLEQKRTCPSRLFCRTDGWTDDAKSSTSRHNFIDFLAWQKDHHVNILRRILSQQNTIIHHHSKRNTWCHLLIRHIIIDSNPFIIPFTSISISVSVSISYISYWLGIEEFHDGSPYSQQHSSTSTPATTTTAVPITCSCTRRQR